MLAAFTAAKLDRNLFTGNAGTPTNPSQANQCILAYCLRMYNEVEVPNGQTDIGSVSEAIMIYPRYQWFSDGRGARSSPLFTMRATTDGQVTEPNNAMSWWDHLNLGQYMRDIFNSTVFLSIKTVLKRSR